MAATNSKKKITTLKSQAGSLLLEVMFTLGLLGAITYAVTSAISQVSNSMSQENKRFIAAQVMTMVMEELSFSLITTDILSAGDHVRYYDNSFRMVPEADKIFTVNWTVTENDPKAGVSRIKLRVSWSAQGPTQELYSETLR